MRQRTPLIAGNWKMNLNHLEAIALTQKIAYSLKPELLAAVDVVVLPPFVDLRSVQTLVDGERLALRYGAQDISAQPGGAYTGDISAAMLTALGVSFVVVGHSERREYHGEDDATVNAKARAALAAGLIPIVCVGEHLPIRTEGRQVPHCVDQLSGALAEVTAEQVAQLVIAYEPVWAIGTGEVATPADAQEVCAALRAEIEQAHGREVARCVRFIYGGSVKSDNAAEILAERDVDGALVGGASLDAEGFAAICRAAAASGTS
ncbi:MAG: triose-phosphate isomerase [Jatrophihabitans sp.]